MSKVIKKSPKIEDDQISWSSDEINFGDFDDKHSIETLGFGLDDSDSESGVRVPKITVAENDNCFQLDVKKEHESDVIGERETVKDAGSSSWTLCGDHDAVQSNLQFIPGQSPTATQLISDGKQPIDYFKQFFTDDLVDKIISATNENAKKKLEEKTLSAHSVWRSWRDVTKEEFWAFLALIINMGTMPLANMQEYWSASAVSHIPFYSDTFTRDRFSQIFWMLNLKTIPARNADPQMRLKHISCFLDYVNAKFLDYFVPGEHIRVEELKKWGIKVYSLADSKTGYNCCILPYYGSLTTEILVRPDLPLSSRIPIHLYQMLLDKIPCAQGHHMYTDNYHTKYNLAQELAKLKCNLTGTILRTRKEFPQEMNQSDYWPNSTIAYRRGDTLIIGWKDREVIACMTTNGDTGMTAAKRNIRGRPDFVVKKPNVILNYAKYMDGNRADQYSSNYCFLQKSLKWWRKLFFCGMETSLTNSYILYKQENSKKRGRPLNHLRFLKILVDELRGTFRRGQREQASTSRSDVIRLNGKLHVLLKGPRRDCKVCSDRHAPGGRREVSYYCDTCPDKPKLHLGTCFIKYHTKMKYRG